MNPSWLNRFDPNVLTQLALNIDYPELLIMCAQNPKLDRVTCNSDAFWKKKVEREYKHPKAAGLPEYYNSYRNYYIALKEYQNTGEHGHLKDHDANFFRVYYENYFGKSKNPFLRRDKEIDDAICRATILGLKDIVDDIRKNNNITTTTVCENTGYTPESLQMTLNDPLIEIPLRQNLLHSAIAFADVPLAEYLLSKGVTPVFTSQLISDIQSNALSIGTGGLNILNRLTGMNYRSSL